MTFTTEKIEQIKAEAGKNWEDNERDGDLINWIISAALSDAFFNGMEAEFGDALRHYDDIPYVDNFHIKNSKVVAANWINGRAFKSSEQALNRILYEAIEAVNSQYKELTAQ